MRYNRLVISSAACSVQRKALPWHPSPLLISRTASVCASRTRCRTLVEFQHVKPGKGGAFVRYKTKDIKTGRVVEQTCNAGSKFESVQLFTKEMQYLYNDGVDFIFMDNETYRAGFRSR